MEHDLKTWPAYFDAILDGTKTFEVRRLDRDFMAGDTLLLREWDPGTEDYTGRTLTRSVGYILCGSMGVNPGHVVMALESPDKANLRAQAERIAALEAENERQLLVLSRAAGEHAGLNERIGELSEQTMRLSRAYLDLGYLPQENELVVDCAARIIEELTAEVSELRTQSALDRVGGASLVARKDHLEATIREAAALCVTEPYAARHNLLEALPALLADEQFVCPECGPTGSDEDGCCSMCGEDCTVEKIPAPPLPVPPAERPEK